MGCAPAKGVAVPEPERSKVYLTATTTNVGVQLSRHMLGDIVEAVPAGSHGAAIGLQEGDIIKSAGKVGAIQFPVKYYNGLDKVALIVKNDVEVSEESPMEMLILRCVVEEKTGMKQTPSKTSTAVSEGSRPRTVSDASANSA
jgi:hypothetical protein